jgi:hypothetical protein
LVIGDTELSTIPNTWDGVRGYADWGYARVDAFMFNEQDITEGEFAGHPSSQVQLGGVYGSYDFPKFSVLGLTATTAIDPYYLYYREAAQTYNDPDLMLPPPAFGPPNFVTGDDVRHTFGVRYHGVIGQFDLDDTFEYQGGSFAGRNVSAWMFATNTGYNFENVAFKPRIGFHFDGASGGDDHNGGTIETYQPLYYSALYYFASLAVAPTNFIDFGPHLSFKPIPGLSLDISDTFVWRENQHDAIYNGLFSGGEPINLYSATANIRGSYTGNQAAALVIWPITKHISVFSQLAYFTPGSALEAIGARGQWEGNILTSFKF